MSQIPEELRFTQNHEWVRVDDDQLVTVGISDHAQQELGDLVFVELPEVGAQLDLGEDAGVVESVKTASDIFAPMSGKVVAVNELLEEAPETLNGDPYGDGWIFQLRINDSEELTALLSPAEYADLIIDDDDEAEDDVD